MIIYEPTAEGISTLVFYFPFLSPLALSEQGSFDA
jgi:hypothetical protein